MRNEKWWQRLCRDPSAQVAAVLAFVISHTPFLAAQDDETGRCPLAVRLAALSYRHFERSREIFLA